VRILVTGGAGFLGSHLSRKLLSLSHEVVSLDNFYTGKKTNIEDLMDHSNFKFVEHDVTLPYNIDCEGIFNLACPASPVQYQRNPVFTLQTNFLGAFHALELAEKNQARVLQASTSEVYGDPEINPQSETYWGNVNPLGIRSCYDEGKRVAESLFADYNRKYGTDIRLPRIFNTYGPYMDKNDGRVVSNFIIQALRGEDLTVYGDGNQTRSFCYVDDLIEGLTRLFFSENIVTPINLGNPTPTSMLKLAQEIITLTNSKSEIVYEAMPLDDPKLREPDIRKAQTLLNWEPQIDRKTGLTRTVEYFQRVL